MNAPSRTAKLSRREFLQLAAIGAAGTVIAACTPPASLSGSGQASAGTAAKKSVFVFECCWNAEHIKAGKELYNKFRSEHATIDVTDFWPAPGEDWTTKLLAK